ncbi:MAG: glutathione S-transferase N-terminal domain-containing protein [Gammaproteobacteria bacterium]|nr:glutathione S-transferase N-terminal domain-containing protein [Gammaproteobacteria bacterium]MDH5653611.1 glutathione S-transferase N-terminal domain-containing protein [Gammaproteobacteria bacterium]
MAQMANRRLAMTLFSADTCPYCHIVRIVLAEKGISFEVQDVDINNTPEDLKDLNPYNETPTLVDRDLVLYDYSVVMEYLDERFPHPPLMPVDPVSRARNRLMLHRIKRDWFALVDRIVAGDDVESARKELRDSLVSASPVFDQKPFFMSDEFTLMDCVLAPLLWRLPQLGVELPAVARPLTEYANRMFTRDSFKSSLTEGEKELRQSA